jgi:hypothetical protein
MNITIMVNENNSVLFDDGKGRMSGKKHSSHSDAMCIAWLARDIFVEKGYNVNLIYNW